MMKPLTLFLVLTAFIVITGCSSLWSQDYHPFPDDKIRVYEFEYFNQPWESFAIQIATRDTLNGDDVFSLNNQVINDYSHDIDPPCLIADGGSWFANLIRVPLGTGSLSIYDESQFHFSIPIDRDVDEALVVAFLPDDKFLVATVVDESEKMVLGREEMVKELYFQVLNQGNQEPNPNHYLHGRTLKIGAESGLVKSVTFNVSESDNPLRGVFRLTQIADDVEEIRPGINEIFPFQAGDSLHVLETLEMITENFRNEIRYEILERDYDLASDKLSFSVRKEFSQYQNTMGEVYESSGVDTVEWVVDPENYLDVKLPYSYATLLPGEQELTDSNDMMMLNYYHLSSGENSAFDRREIHFFQEHMFIHNSPNCLFYSAPLGHPSYYSKYFIEGLGGPYFYLNDLHRRPVFASTADERWGEPLDFVVSIDEVMDDEIVLKLFPNPVVAGDELTVKTNHYSDKHVEIYNVQGTKVLSMNGNEDAFTISTSMLPTGTYILRLIEADNPPVSRKFIVR